MLIICLLIKMANVIFAQQNFRGEFLPVSIMIMIPEK